MMKKIKLLLVLLAAVNGAAYAAPAFETEVHRNLFVEMGIAGEAAVQNKVNSAYQQLFYGDPGNQAVYFEHGGDMAYIKAIDSNDIRSEGMSYGMIIAVMMDDQTAFDKLWKFSKQKMQHQSGDRQYYFSWQLNASSPFSAIDQNSAPDGEEYFAMALMFAANRWGNRGGIFNYSNEANLILNEMVNKVPNATAVPIINPVHNQVVFTPFTPSEAYTDPSYHVPAFYELWAKWAAQDNLYWRTVAETSREFFNNAAHPTTGLFSDYAEFDGTPKPTSFNPNSHLSAFDAMRTIQNIAVDYAWFEDDSRAVTLANRLLSFYHSQGNYVTVYTVDGQPQVDYRMEAHVAMNAVAAFAADIPQARDFVEDLWNLNIPTGQWRYYNGMLYLLGLLHTSGTFKIYKPGGTGGIPVANPQSVVTDRDQAVDITLSGSDADGSITAYNIVNQPNHGSTIASGNIVTYTPDSGYVGSDAFTFTVTDNDGNVSTGADISIEVRAGDTGQGVTCSVSENVWNTGYTATVTVTNASSDPVTGWTVALTLDAGDTIVQHWSAQLDGDRGSVNASNLSWNGFLGSGQSTQFGFNGAYGGGSRVPVSCQ